jgi:hypothetical protein
MKRRRIARSVDRFESWNMPIGRCPLCRKEGKELQESHDISAGVYRIAGRDGDPVVMTPEIFLSTTRQLKEYLLCSDCEQMLAKKGEDYVIPLLRQDKNNFPLLKLLRSANRWDTYTTVLSYFQDRWSELIPTSWPTTRSACSGKHRCVRGKLLTDNLFRLHRSLDKRDGRRLKVCLAKIKSEFEMNNIERVSVTCYMFKIQARCGVLAKDNLTGMPYWPKGQRFL